MQRKIAYAVLLSVIVPAVIAGCAASRAYTEGILATSDTYMSTEELRSLRPEDRSGDRPGEQGRSRAGRRVP